MAAMISTGRWKRTDVLGNGLTARRDVDWHALPGYESSSK